VLFFLGHVLYHGFSNRSRSGFDHSRCSGCRSSSGLSFLATTTHFTWVIRRTTVLGQGAGRCGFNHRSSHFGNHRGFNHRRRLCNHYRCGFNHFGSRGWRFLNHRGRRWRFNRGGRFGSPLEGSLFFANFTHGRGCFFDNRCFCCGFNHWCRLNHRSRFNGNHFGFWLCVANRGNFHLRNHWGFDRGSGFDHWRFNSWRLNLWGLGS